MSVYSDPPSDSLFRKLTETTCACTICGATVPNNVEGRDAHLNSAEFSQDSQIKEKHRALYEAT